MTNHIHAKAEWNGTCWLAKVRYSHKKEYWTLQDSKGKDLRYPTKEAAELAALRAQEKHINGTITGFGEKAEAARIAGDRLFRLGKKPIDVETKRRVRA